MKKQFFSSLCHFSACVLPPCVHSASDSNTAASLLTKRFILVASVENNKTLNPGRAGEPYVPCCLSSKEQLCLLFNQRRLYSRFFRGAPASCHISEAAMWLWMEISECWWAEDDLNWLLGKQRELPAFRVACWISASTQLSHTLNKKKKDIITCKRKEFNKEPCGFFFTNQRPSLLQKGSILDLNRIYMPLYF